MKDFSECDIITSTVKDFSWYDVKFINELHYHTELNEYYEEIFVLDIGFVAITKQKKQYKLKMRFSEVESGNFDICSPGIQLIQFEILDIKDDGWSSVRYWIRDVESDNIKFYCNKIEILSFEYDHDINSTK